MGTEFCQALVVDLHKHSSGSRLTTPIIKGRQFCGLSRAVRTWCQEVLVQEDTCLRIQDLQHNSGPSEFSAVQ